MTPRTAGAKRQMQPAEDDGGSSEDFDAVPLDFLFELDPWLFPGLDGGDALPPAQDAPTLLLSPSSLSMTATTPRFASFPTDGALYCPAAASEMIVPPPLAAPPLAAPPVAPTPPRLAPGPPPRSFAEELTITASSASTHSSVSSECAQPVKKKAKPNKSTSQRQKEELTFLRSKVEELEEHLKTLKSGPQSAPDETSKHPRIKSEASSSARVAEVLPDGEEGGVDLKPADEDDEDDEDPGEASLWERIAKRQQEEKTKAEVENMKLREMVEGQIKLVRSFERLLRKRQIWEQLQEDKWHKSEPGPKQDEQIFEELMASIDARRPMLQSIFDANALNNSSPEGGDANLKYAATDGMYLEFKDTKFLPFDHKMIDSVMWRSIRQGKIKLDDHNIVATKEVGNAVMSKAVVAKAGGCSKPTTVWSVVKRFVEKDHFEFVYETTVVIPSMPGTALPPVRLVQQGWGRLATTALRDGSSGTVMQSYSMSVPTVLEAEPSSELQQHQQHREIDILTELIFTSYQQSRQTLHQVIENLVLDEALARGSDRS